MVLKIFKGVWFLSVVVLFATLLYGYAGWQQEMIIQDDASGKVSASKDLLFYILTGVFLLVNVMVYLVSRFYPSNENLRSWFHGLIITVNVFLVISMNLLGVYNSGESFDFERVGFMIYGSIWLIVAWALAWPAILLFQKIFVKQAVS